MAVIHDDRKKGGSDKLEENKTGEATMSMSTTERIAELEQKLAALEAKFNAERERLAGFMPQMTSDIVAYVRRKIAEIMRRALESNPGAFTQASDETVRLAKKRLTKLDECLESAVKPELDLSWLPHRDLDWKHEVVGESCGLSRYSDRNRSVVSVVRSALYRTVEILTEAHLAGHLEVLEVNGMRFKGRGWVRDSWLVQAADPAGELTDPKSGVLSGYIAEARDLYRIAHALKSTRDELDRLQARKRWDEAA